MLIEILTFSFMKMRLKVSSEKWRPFCLRLNVLNKLKVDVHTHAGNNSTRRPKLASSKKQEHGYFMDLLPTQNASAVTD